MNKLNLRICVGLIMKRYRAWRESNPRPSGPESDTLSTELHARNLLFTTALYYIDFVFCRIASYDN